jgi:hypothetical protein
LKPKNLEPCYLTSASQFELINSDYKRYESEINAAPSSS